MVLAIQQYPRQSTDEDQEYFDQKYMVSNMQVLCMLAIFTTRACVFEERKTPVMPVRGKNHKRMDKLGTTYTRQSAAPPRRIILRYFTWRRLIPTATGCKLLTLFLQRV